MVNKYYDYFQYYMRLYTRSGLVCQENLRSSDQNLTTKQLTYMVTTTFEPTRQVKIKQQHLTDNPAERSVP